MRDNEGLFFGVAGTLAAILLGVALTPLRGLTPASNLAFAFMALTIVVAERGGRGPALATALASALSLDFFLTQPYLRLSIEDKHDVLAFVGLAVCGLIAGGLGSQRGRGAATHSARAKHRPTTELGNDERAMEGELVAELNQQHFGGMKMASLRWLAATSLPVWLHAQFHTLPDLLVFWAILVQGFCLLLAIAFARLESLWRGRSLRLQDGESPGVVHTPLSSWQELRVALWQGMALVSLVPLAYVVFDRPIPSPLLSATVAAGITVLLLLLVAEIILRLGPSALKG